MIIKLKLYVLIAIAALFVLIFIACTGPTPSPMPAPIPAPTPVPAPEPRQDNLAIIVDRDGREWDVTHARDVYDMNPSYYNYGIGIGAIPSVDNPTVIEEDEPGYPEPASNIRVFGVDHNGEQRAYSVSDLAGHEVFNDIYPGKSDQYVAVTYWPLADLAVVYSREIDGNILTLTPSGWTYGEDPFVSVFVLMDEETESLWFPADESFCTLPADTISDGSCGLVGIGGIYADRTLNGIQILSMTTWAEWKKAFPDTKFVTE